MSQSVSDIQNFNNSANHSLADARLNEDNSVYVVAQTGSKAAVRHSLMQVVDDAERARRGLETEDGAEEPSLQFPSERLTRTQLTQNVQLSSFKEVDQPLRSSLFWCVANCVLSFAFICAQTFNHTNGFCCSNVAVPSGLIPFGGLVLLLITKIGEVKIADLRSDEKPELYLACVVCLLFLLVVVWNTEASYILISILFITYVPLLVHLVVAVV